jgi:hypothetical protein
MNDLSQQSFEQRVDANLVRYCVVTETLAVGAWGWEVEYTNFYNVGGSHTWVRYLSSRDNAHRAIENFFATGDVTGIEYDAIPPSERAAVNVRGVTANPDDGPRGSRWYRHGSAATWTGVGAAIGLLFLVLLGLSLFGAWIGWW